MATFPITKRKFKWQFPIYRAKGGRKLFFYWCFTCKRFHWPYKIIKEPLTIARLLEIKKELDEQERKRPKTYIDGKEYIVFGGT